MKSLLAYSFICLLILGVIEAPTTAENRRRRCRPQPRVTKDSNVQGVGTLEQKDKTIAECELSNKRSPLMRLVVSRCRG